MGGCALSQVYMQADGYALTHSICNYPGYDQKLYCAVCTCAFRINCVICRAAYLGLERAATHRCMSAAGRTPSMTARSCFQATALLSALWKQCHCSTCTEQSNAWAYMCVAQLISARNCKGHDPVQHTKCQILVGQPPCEHEQLIIKVRTAAGSHRHVVAHQRSLTKSHATQVT
jgi:hypothetical protein